MQEDEKELVIVFTNTRRETDRVAQLLKKEGIKAAAIHGGLSQNQRLRVIKLFNKKNNLHVLVCTDVAARGLDIPGVSHVYNYDVPNEAKQYLHRIGRTARAGADGKAINLVNKRDKANYKDVLRDNNLNIPVVELPALEVLQDDRSSATPVNRRGRFPKRSETRRPKNYRTGPRNKSLDGSGTKSFQKRRLPTGKKAFSRGRKQVGVKKKSFRTRMKAGQ